MASTACIPSAPAPGDAAALRDRARGALLGLAVGDALGAPAENMTPSQIRARWGRITGYVAEHPAGTDDTEYAILSGLLLARHGSALTVAHVESAWRRWIADRDEGPFRGAGFSERGTLENLRRGLAAPLSAQHRHAWSDGLAMRAAPFGVFAAGRPAEAARLVAIDGSVSHDGEGIYGGRAVAAGVAAAMAGAPAPRSWPPRSPSSRRTPGRPARCAGPWPWPTGASTRCAPRWSSTATPGPTSRPRPSPSRSARTRRRTGEFAASVLTAVNMGRDADTTAAVAGALAGASRGMSAIPAAWARAIGPARGSCLPSMAGHHILDVAELLAPESGEKWRTAAGHRPPPPAGSGPRPAPGPGHRADHRADPDARPAPVAADAGARP